MRTWTILLAAVVAATGAVSAARAQSRPGALAPAPTFVADVAPLLHRHCATCHRTGEMAPMPLLTYANVRPWAKAIRAQVGQRRMPPWFADPAVGHFKDTLRLADADVDTIARWVDGGGQAGRRTRAQAPVDDAGLAHWPTRSRAADVATLSSA